MTLIQLAILGLLFLAVFGIAMTAMVFFNPSATRERLKTFSPGRQVKTTGGWVERVASVTGTAEQTVAA